MIRLDMDLIVAANPGIAVSETGVVARVVQILCKRCLRLAPVDHGCGDVTLADVIYLPAADTVEEVAARTRAAPSR